RWRERNLDTVCRARGGTEGVPGSGALGKARIGSAGSESGGAGRGGDPGAGARAAAGSRAGCGSATGGGELAVGDGKALGAGSWPAAPAQPLPNAPSMHPTTNAEITLLYCMESPFSREDRTSAASHLAQAVVDHISRRTIDR